MRWGLLVALGACYGAPAVDPCQIRCTDSCPGDLACVGGFCVAAGEVCQPAFAHVSAGNGFACGIDNAAYLWCWGANTHHQIDGSAQVFFDHAVQVGEDAWDAIRTGGGHACGLRAGELWCWGENDRGQVDSSTIGDIVAPTKIAPPNGPATWTAVATGYNATCAIGDGRLFCWGAGDLGQLGNATMNDGPPTEVTGQLADWSAVSVGHKHTCAISTSLGLQCWGDNQFGELGDGTQTASAVPTSIALPNAAQVAVALESTCATTTDGALYCWGYSGDGELGDPGAIPADGSLKLVPTLASGLTGWSQLAAAELYSCALRNDELWCWGKARNGGMGNGIWFTLKVFARITTGASEVSLGWNANFEDGTNDSGDLDLSCAVFGTEIRCWGDNRFGELAQGGATMQPAPVEVAGGHVWTALAAGAAHACGLDAGELYCWGSTQAGQIDGVEAGTTTPCGATPVDCDVGAPKRVDAGAGTTALSLGTSHTCVLHGTTVTCWGDDSTLQVGNALYGIQMPHDVAGTWASLMSLEQSGACAVQNGETWCWGAVLHTQLPTHEPALDGAAAVSLGRGFGCALDASHALACFGDNAVSELGNGEPGVCGDLVCNNRETSASCSSDCGPGPLTPLGRSYLAISGGWTRFGSQFMCGIALDGTVECWGDNGRGESAKTEPATGALVNPVTTPFIVPGLTACTAISASDVHACALCAGTVECWGDNRRGGIGIGTLGATPVTVPRTVELPLAAGDSIAQLVSGSGFSCVRSAQGHAYCWGLSAHGALGVGATGANVPIPVKSAVTDR